MADVLHSALTGADLHECKGAASAAAGQVPVANGTGSAPFIYLPYTAISGRPVTPVVSFNGGDVGTTPAIRHYILTAVGGSWSQAITGITTLHGVQAQVVSPTAGASNAFIATVNTATTATVTGQVVKADGTALGTTQTIFLTVFGV